MGKKEYFDPLEVSLQKVFDKNSKIQKNETDDGIPTQTLLQVLRTYFYQSSGIFNI